MSSLVQINTPSLNSNRTTLNYEIMLWCAINAVDKRVTCFAASWIAITHIERAI